MADFMDEFKTRLKAVSDVTDLVGSGTSARIYPDRPRQGCSMPAIAYTESGGTSYQTLKGIAGFVRTIMHVWAYGSTRAQANNLAEVIRTKALNSNFKGNFGSTHVSGINASSHRDAGIDQQKGTDAPRYWCRRIYDIWHVEDTS